MNDPMKDAWNDVAEGFGSLGRLMKERFEVEVDETAQPSPDEGTAGREELRDAFERLVAAGRDVGQRAVDVLRDDDVKAQAKHAATALNDALSATVDLIGREVGGFFGRGDKPDEARPTDDPAVVGAPEDVPEAVRPSVTGVVTGPIEEQPDGDDGDPGRADGT